MKYVPSAMIGQLSRSSGSTTASHNRFGAYLRNRTIPTNPRTSKQTTQRNVLGDASGAFRALTSAQIAAWAAYGAQLVRTDSLGQSYSLTGLQAFTSAYRIASTLGVTTLANAPAAPVAVTPFAFGAITATA